MSTRGFLGFVAKGVTKVGYNHCDSYPSHLGLGVLAWLRSVDHDRAFELAVNLRVVDTDKHQSD